MHVTRRSFPLTLVVALAFSLLVMTPRAAAQMRPIDLEYQQNPAKRAADLEELKALLAGIEKQYEVAEATLTAGDKGKAAEDFVGVARSAGRLLLLYEMLGFNFKNEKLGYPHYLIYKLESHLTGTKETKGPKGETIRSPADPEAAKILSYAGVLGRPGRPAPQIVDSSAEVSKLHESASKIMEFLREKIIAANVPLE